MTHEPAQPFDPKCRLVFDARGGYKVAQAEGQAEIDYFDAHPFGEGEGRPNWVCRGCGERQFSIIPPGACPKCGATSWVQGPQFIQIECLRSEIPQFIVEEGSEDVVRRIVDGIWEISNPWDSTDRQVVFVEDEPEPLRCGRSRPVAKLDLVAFTTLAKSQRITDAGSANVYRRAALVTKAGSVEDYIFESQRVDTRRNAAVTVGDGKTHATIGAAFAAANSGDVIEIYAKSPSNTYTETLSNSTKALIFRGMVDTQGIIMTSSAGATGTLALTTVRSIVENMTLQATGTQNYALWLRALSSAKNCLCEGSDAYTVYNQDGWIYNLVVRNGVVGVQFSNPTYAAAHTISFGHSSHGYSGGANDTTGILCVAHTNGGNDYNSTGAAGFNMLNVSEDGTEVGGGSIQDAGIAADYDADGRLTTAATGASFYGYPWLVADDIDSQARKQTGVVFAGPSDADPDVPVGPTFTGAFTAARGDAQNSAVLDISGCSTADVDHFLVFSNTASLSDGDLGDNTYLSGAARAADSEIVVRHDKDNARWLQGQTYYYRIVAVGSNGGTTINANEASLTLPGYLERAEV